MGAGAGILHNWDWRHINSQLLLQCIIDRA
jgi:hypothetical protein